MTPVTDEESEQSFISHLEELKIPEEWARHEWETDADTLRDLNAWKARATRALEVLSRSSIPTDDNYHEFAMRIAAFDGNDKFSSGECRVSAQRALEKVFVACPEPSSGDRRRKILKDILEYDIKPLFLANAHPRVNLDSGRKLFRIAGGPAAAQDMYEDQLWKRRGLGCWNVIRWSVIHMQREDFELLWPLLIPPLMTLLDDYDPPFKIRGIEIAHEMLRKVDANLINRTGISTLLSSSLTNAFAFMTAPETPQLLVAAVPCYQDLIYLTTSEGSEQRFEKLCELMTSAIIGGAWSYGGNQLSTMEASIQVLPPLIHALGIGTARFLKALIPQLSDMLVTKPFLPATPRLQVLSADCLCVIISECPPRISFWRLRILDGLARCWVQLKEGNAKASPDIVVETMQKLAQELVKSAPSLKEKEIPRLMDKDPAMFGSLFGDV
ncbi:hypothetical protein BS47DRAFT_1335069 [Hydnum rufescens UP504]|uniref:Uncharacterized protein n=1 Tax=Hydnum rufescens UP504 TaxID=1448309 RepID=A0A9P6BDM7_9AGAM|nr:hypothetical protein BS47DRAFT_1335069 [Hydnum rufescens UP504]